MATRDRTTRMTLDEARAAAATTPPIPTVSDDEIERRAAADPDAPLATDEQLAAFEREYPPGATRLRPKQLLSLRIDADVVEAYRATGPGWQRRMHDVLAAGAPARAPRTHPERRTADTSTIRHLQDRVERIEHHLSLAQRQTAPRAKEYRHIVERSGASSAKNAGGARVGEQHRDGRHRSTSGTPREKSHPRAAGSGKGRREP